MPQDALLTLLTNTNIDSGNDGLGTGSDPTVGTGAIVAVDEDAPLCVVLTFGLPTGGDPAGDADTAIYLVEESVDGGSTWVRRGTFRTVLGAEIPNNANDPSVRLALEIRASRANAGQSGLVKWRLNGTASDTSDWNVHADIRSRQDCREEWFRNAGVVHA